MATVRTMLESKKFHVIHPLNDNAERKCSSEGLGSIAMTRTVRASLTILRGYLILMTGMLGYDVLRMASVFRHFH